MKRPAFQFYPADWRGNANLSRCSHRLKGVWLDVMCLLHDSDEYGVCRWPLAEIAQSVKCSVKDLRDLQAKDVLKGADRGETARSLIYTPRHAGREGDPVTLIPEQEGPIWFSSRMVRDEYIRMKRGESTRYEPGEKSGPKDAPKPKPKPPIGDGSSSSSSSSSSEERGEGAKPKQAGSQARPAAQPLLDPALGPASKAERATRLPDPWTLPVEWRAAAVEKRREFNRPEINLDLEAERFRLYWHGAGGTKGRKVNWRSTWLKWALDSNGAGNGKGHAGTSDDTARRRAGLAGAYEARFGNGARQPGADRSEGADIEAGTDARPVEDTGKLV